MGLFSSISESDARTKNLVVASRRLILADSELHNDEAHSTNELKREDRGVVFSRLSPILETMSISGNNDDRGVVVRKLNAKTTVHQTKDTNPPIMNEYSVYGAIINLMLTEI